MPDNDLTDVKIAIAKLEQVSLATAEAARLNTTSNTGLSDSIKDLIGEMQTRDVKNDLLFEKFSETATRINSELHEVKEHIKMANPVLLRSKKYQDNIDKMVTSIFSKTGFVILGIITLVILTLLGVNPSKFK